MTEHIPSKPTAQAARRRPPLYRTVLSLGIAALVAAWLPFSLLYINALSSRVGTVNAVGTRHMASAMASHPATVAPVKTRTS